MTLELINRFAREAAKLRLDFLLIGGHAVIHHGHQRMTIDVDFLCRAAQRGEWGSLVEQYGYKAYSIATAFTQFAGEPGWPKVDLMFVDDDTFEKLNKGSVRKGEICIPSVRHMIALKLHAARSTSRTEPQKDWADIEVLIKLHQMDPAEPEFQKLILRYGGEESLARIRDIWQNLKNNGR